MNRLLFFAFLILFSCTSKSKRDIHRGFYFWKSKFQLNEKDQEKLHSLKANKIYVKFFDVDWNVASAKPIPVAVVQPEGILDTTFQIVPTIFITNNTFEKGDEFQLNNLSYNVYNKIVGMQNCFPRKIKINEIQIDCDWNDATGEKYFNFLKYFKRLSGPDKKISTTIRLHQIKYFEKTGVPPVDRGMLMFYNMGNVNFNFPANSIYNKEDALKYLESIKNYPLPLDIALPIFSWAAIYRDEKLVQLIRDFDKNLYGNKALVEIEKNIFKASQIIDLKSAVIKKGDIVKFEIMDPSSTLEAAQLIEKHSKDSISVVLFDYNNLNFNRYNDASLENIFDTFD